LSAQDRPSKDEVCKDYWAPGHVQTQLQIDAHCDDSEPIDWDHIDNLNASRAEMENRNTNRLEEKATRERKMREKHSNTTGKKNSDRLKARKTQIDAAQAKIKRVRKDKTSGGDE